MKLSGYSMRNFPLTQNFKLTKALIIGNRNWDEGIRRECYGASLIVKEFNYDSFSLAELKINTEQAFAIFDKEYAYEPEDECFTRKEGTNC